MGGNVESYYAELAEEQYRREREALREKAEQEVKFLRAELKELHAHSDKLDRRIEALVTAEDALLREIARLS